MYGWLLGAVMFMHVCVFGRAEASDPVSCGWLLGFPVGV